jgi:hypothetical protein
MNESPDRTKWNDHRLADEQSELIAEGGNRIWIGE